MDIEFLNSYFDKIYVITLPDQEARQENIKNILGGLKYEFFFGADKRQFSIEELERNNIYDHFSAKNNNRYNKPMTIAQVCCAWSHKMVYQEILQGNFERTLILEDDVEPSNAACYAANVFHELPSGWEILYLDYNKNEYPKKIKQRWYHLQRRLGKLKWGSQIINNLYPVNFSRHLSKAGYHDYADAYAITNRAAQKLISLQTPISFPADHLLSYASASTQIHAFISRPKLFYQLSQGVHRRMSSLVE